MENRNIAIIAHVDHGKTTLVDRLLQETVVDARTQLEERALDSNELERERGITILSKTTAVEYRGVRINIVDTPGHTDFGGEVERVLSMVDAVLLLVDAVEGPMPQTRFVTSKAFEQNLRPILVVNKIDRDGARPYEVVDGVFDLFLKLDATEEQLDFPVVFTSAIEGTSGLEPDQLQSDMSPLLDLMIDKVPPPNVRSGPFQMQVCTLDYSPYVGVIGIGRVNRGSIKTKETVCVLRKDGSEQRARIQAIHANRGLDRVELNEAHSGDIVCITGVEDVQVSDTICDPNEPEAMAPLEVDKPTVTVSFCVNDSPFAGKEGRFLTSRQIGNRLFTEASHNVALRVASTREPDVFEVSGRGELHLSVLIETMRREGYEFAVSRPEVILQVEDGIEYEPFDTVIFDIETIHQGDLMQRLGERRGELIEMHTDPHQRIRLTYKIATRALMGFRAIFATATSGTGIMTYATAGYDRKIDGLEVRRRSGALVSNSNGSAVAYALFNLQNRGRLIVGPGTSLYKGLIVGLHSRSNDLTVNPSKEKKLTNIRAAGSDENIILTPPLQLTLEQALETINDDELVEVTPKSIRLRKKDLDAPRR